SVGVATSSVFFVLRVLFDGSRPRNRSGSTRQGRAVCGVVRAEVVEVSARSGLLEGVQSGPRGIQLLEKEAPLVDAQEAVDVREDDPDSRKPRECLDLPKVVQPVLA